MNFRDLVTRLDLIENAGLTLAAVQAAEQAAKEKASVEKAKGGWSGFTSWDPKSAGNIAIAKLAQQNRLEGLFNSEGDFVVAYGSNEWSSKEGQSPRVAPPTPEDWKPLASLGLIPDNAKGPAGLTDWLTGGKSKQEFDAVKQQSAGVRQAAMQQPDQPAAVTSPVVAPTDLKSTPLSPISSEVPASKSLDAGEELVPKSGSGAPSEKAKEVDDLLKQYLSMNDSDSEDDEEFAEGMYKSLVESFGYSANEDQKLDTLVKVLSHPGTMIGLGSAHGAFGDERTSPKVGMGGYKWDADIVPGIPYTLSDAALDAGLTVGGMALGAFGGPVGVTAAAAANANKIQKLISVVKAAAKTTGIFTKTMVGTAIPANLQYNAAQEISHAVKNMYLDRNNCDNQMPGQPPVKNPCKTD